MKRNYIKDYELIEKALQEHNENNNHEFTEEEIEKEINNIMDVIERYSETNRNDESLELIETLTNNNEMQEFDELIDELERIIQ